jgi:hypothetical protein
MVVVSLGTQRRDSAIYQHGLILHSKTFICKKGANVLIFIPVACIINQ